ncbi:MAG: thiamine pyrophosphate-dependent dehydrogenase E1 component subunit alpha [Alicyclobacillus sp.]|nr:thiamine pyrophosphate-dependent dehydrogenase E1 component subunit alpha [Alicyclobacillus sp.]
MGFWEETDVREQWRRMLAIRRFEEAMIQNGDAFPGHRHVYIGQEATAVGAVAALEETDPIVTTHRNHGHNLARGAAAAPMMAEVFGKVTGFARGKSGTFHIALPEHHVVVASAVVAGSLCIALGLALAAKCQGSRRVAVAFFGDGAVNEGTFHETANLAALWDVPLLMICENNSGGLPRDSGLAGPSIAGLAGAYGIPYQVVDGSDVASVYAAVRRAVSVLRGQAGPWFIEAQTIGWPGNRGGWPHLVDGVTDLTPVLTGAPLSGWAVHDPVLKFAEAALQHGWTAADLQAVDQEVQQDIAQAVEQALAAPYPPADEALLHVWA